MFAKILFIFLVTLFVFLFLTLNLNTDTSSPSPDYFTYNDSSGEFSFQYPAGFTRQENQGKVTILSPRSVCPSPYLEGYDLKMDFQIHSGQFNRDLWNQPDGQTQIDGKNAYFFYQGAEMPYGRIAYLVDISPVNALEINVWTPELIYNCDPEISKDRGQKVAGQILASLKIHTSGDSQFCGGIAGIACPSGFTCRLDGNYPDAGGTCIKKDAISGCRIGGCSGELCLDSDSPDVSSICIYRDEYACYKYSVCETQSNGKCAWTQTPAYQTCIENLRH